MSTLITPIEKVIPESDIIIFSPHYDDVLFMLGGYLSELKNAGKLAPKNIRVILLFSKSNYLARTGEGNFDTSLDRVKLATGKRLLEDQQCLDELLGEFNYGYELAGEVECFARGKKFADSSMEFPHGMFEDFDEKDAQIFERMKGRIRHWATMKNTALIFPLAFKEHIDHFIVREAAIEVARQTGNNASARFYFQEDKPYGGIATDTEFARTNKFISDNKLSPRSYEYDPELMVELAFKHYISQVEEVYKTGILTRANYLQNELGAGRPCDRIYVFN